MKKKNIWDERHPFPQAVYFIIILVFTMIFKHPASLVISFLGALVTVTVLRGFRKTGRLMLLLIPIMLFTAVINPLFSHQGQTVLAYFSSGNPLTLESIIFGVYAAFMMAAVLLWFTCLNEIITADKWIFLLGRSFPTMSLLLSMSLNFIPQFLKKLKAMVQIQRSLGRSVYNGHIRNRLRYASEIMASMTEQSLENSLETADSMKSRGYGLEGRTFFSVFKWHRRDTFLLTLIIAGTVCSCVGIHNNFFSWTYYPQLSKLEFTYPALSYACFGVYLVLCFLFPVLKVAEDIRWKRIQSGI